MKNSTKKQRTGLIPDNYTGLVSGISGLLEQARRTAVRTINSVLTATYWEIGRLIVEFEQGGQAKAEYGDELLVKLGRDLTAKYGRGFSMQGLYKMRGFYLAWEIFPTPSGKLEARGKCPTALSGSRAKIIQTMSEQTDIPPTLSAECLAGAFPPEADCPRDHMKKAGVLAHAGLFSHLEADLFLLLE